MKFFDRTRNVISALDWLKTYEPCYFLCGPCSRGINQRNQSSHFVEDKVCALLEQSTLLSKQDLILLMAWKIGRIDQRRSEEVQEILYRRNFDKTLIDKGRFGTLNFSKSIPYLADHMPEIVRGLAQDRAYLLNRIRGPHPELESFGPTFILTVQFFITHGRDPIYDKFAHMGAIAINECMKPDDSIRWVPIQNSSEYQHYVDLLKPISAICTQPASGLPMTVPRPVDRTLWVYGHLYQEVKPMRKVQALPTRAGPQSSST